MKYIIFSDIHLSNWHGGSSSKERISQRLLDQKSILQQLIDLSIEHNAMLLHGGDVFHCVGSVPTEALNVYKWFINECKKCGIKYYTVTGNHDLAIRKGFSEWHNVLNLFQTTEERNKELSALNPTIKFVDYQDEDVENIKGYDILILHKQPETSNRYGFKHEGINWKTLAETNRLSFYGHFHETKKLSDTAFVIGQPMQMTQSDVDQDRGCWIVDSEDWSVEFKKLDYPELKRLEKIEVKHEAKFEERIKAVSFQDILVEWLDREMKPNSYLELIQQDITDKTQVSKTFFNGKIQSVYLKDFLSVDEITVELQNGFWLVMGDNGGGKTTITGEGIYWILFDDTTKGLSKNEVVRNRPTQQKEAVGELIITDEEKTYAIRRSSKKGLEIICDDKNLVDGMTKSLAQEYLEKHVLGFDKTTYQASCYFSQNQLLTLAQLGDADTTNLVTNLLGFETYDSLYVQMDLKKKENALQIDLLEQSSAKIRKDIELNQIEQKHLSNSIECSLTLQCSLKAEHLKVTNEIAETNTLLGNIVIPTVTTEEIDIQISKLNVHKTEMSTKNQTLQQDGLLRTKDLRKQLEILQKDSTTVIQRQNEIDKDKLKLGAETTAISNEIARHDKIIASLQESKCSYCGTILNKEELTKHLEKEQSEIAALRAKLCVWNPDKDKELEALYDKEVEIQELIANINQQIKESDAEINALLSENFAEITKIDCDIQELQVKKGQVIKEQTEANTNKDNLIRQAFNLENRKMTLEKQLAQINTEEHEKQIKVIESNNLKLDAELIDIADKIKILAQNKEIYEFWQNAFSTKGIRPLLLDKFVNEFNSIVESYCYDVSGGEFVVKFTPTSKTNSGLERNKLGLQVIYKDKTVNYAALSGGEQTRCNLPLCLGLNTWISKKHGIPNGIFGLIVLDELFAHLDVKGRDNVAELLNDEGKNKSIFVIDHSEILASYTDKMWIITKENDVTKLQELK